MKFVEQICSASRDNFAEIYRLLLLQQILFFRELRFNLNDIQKLLSQNDFDNVKALYAHRKILEKDIDRKNSLIATIDKTIQHLRGKQVMKDEELYYGFDKAKQKEYEQYLVKYHGTDAEKLLLESKKATAKWDKDEWDDVKNQGDAIHKALAEAIEQGAKADSDAVQALLTAIVNYKDAFMKLQKICI